MSAVCFTPTCSMSCANTVLIDFTVPVRSVTAPPPSPSLLPMGWQPPPTRP